MQWNQLKKINADADRIPAEGMMLAYTRTKVIFHPFSSLEEVRQSLEGEDILELHLFDRSAEYRALSSRSVRYADRDGVIETIVDFPETSEEPEDGDVYSEEILLERSDSRITVLNHITYDERGMATVDNYRLRS